MIPLYNENARVWMHEHWGLLMAACISSVFLSCVMICCMNLTRLVPVNYILMILFTVCEAYMVASIAAQVNDPHIVI